MNDDLQAPLGEETERNTEIPANDVQASAPEISQAEETESLPTTSEPAGEPPLPEAEEPAPNPIEELERRISAAIAETERREPAGDGETASENEPTAEGDEPREASEEEKKASFDAYVKMSIESGVPPLELQFKQIGEVMNPSPLAYRTYMKVNSVIKGELPEEGYTPATDNRETAKDLLTHSIRHVTKAYRKFLAAERTVEFLSVRCPSEITELEGFDLFATVKEILERNPSFPPAKLCLEFPAELLIRDTERAKSAILDMKVLGVKTALLGGGKEDFFLSKILTVCPDYVILDPTVTAYAGNRDKPALLVSLVSYINSMGAEVIAEGDGEFRKALRNTDCIAFIDTASPLLTLEEAVAEKEADS